MCDFITITPGPAAYSPNLKLTQQQSRKFTIARKFKEVVKPTLASNKYDPSDKSIQPNICFSIGQKINNKLKPSPGPCDYNINEKVTNGEIAHIYMHGRTHLISAQNISPGPKYNPDMSLVRRSAPTFKISKQASRKMVVDPSYASPTQYKPDKQVVSRSAPRITMSFRYKGLKVDEMPSPNQYNIKFMHEGVKPMSMSWRRKQFFQ
ncbi:SHIPPO_1-like protein [Hexamita inflata]|uniref:SHIPPO 1-like protein n=1 Tax=Hexamita inflata TaxID=28002 RepID=A0AA86U815_9EUKA|nr:SHIPPO 1-like protein [Hexamita inflata]